MMNATSVVLFAKSSQDVSTLTLSQWMLASNNRTLKARYSKLDGAKDWMVIVRLINTDAKDVCPPLPKKSKREKYTLTPSTNVFVTFPIFNWLICLDFSESMFSLTEHGLPCGSLHQFLFEALTKVVNSLLQSQTTKVEKVGVYIIGHRPETNRTFSIWRGEIDRRTDTKLLCAMIRIRIEKTEEEHSNRHVDPLGSFPSIDTFIRALQCCNELLPSNGFTKATLLTRGAFSVDIVSAHELLSRSGLSLSVVVELINKRRCAATISQDLYELKALTQATRGSFDVIDNEYGTSDAHMDGFDETFFMVPLLCRHTSHVDMYNTIQPRPMGTPTSEIILQSYQLEGATVEQLISLRTTEGFRLTFIGIEDATEPLGNTIARLEKSVSKLTVVVYEISFRQRRELHGSSWTSGVLNIDIRRLNFKSSEIPFTVPRRSEDVATNLSHSTFEADKRIASLTSLLWTSFSTRHQSEPFAYTSKSLSAFADVYGNLASLDQATKFHLFLKCGLCHLQYGYGTDATFTVDHSPVLGRCIVQADLLKRMEQCFENTDIHSLSNSTWMILIRGTSTLLLLEIDERHGIFLTITIRKVSQTMRSHARETKIIRDYLMEALSPFCPIECRCDLSTTAVTPSAPLASVLQGAVESELQFSVSLEKCSMCAASPRCLRSLIFELVNAKARLGFHLGSQSTCNEGDDSEWQCKIAMCAVVTGCPSGISMLDSLLQCFISASVDVDSRNMASISIKYYWPKSSNESQYGPSMQFVSANAEIVNRKVEWFVEHLKDQDKQIFDIYSSLAPFLSQPFPPLRVAVPSHRNERSASVRIDAEMWRCLRSYSTSSQIKLPKFYRNTKRNLALRAAFVADFVSGEEACFPLHINDEPATVVCTGASLVFLRIIFQLISYTNPRRLIAEVSMSTTCDLEICSLPIPICKLWCSSVLDAAAQSICEGESCQVNDLFSTGGHHTAGISPSMRHALWRQYMHNFVILTYRALKLNEHVHSVDLETALSAVCEIGISEVKMEIEISEVARRWFSLASDGHRDWAPIQTAFNFAFNKSVRRATDSGVFVDCKELSDDLHDAVCFVTLKLEFQESGSSVVFSHQLKADSHYIGNEIFAVNAAFFKSCQVTEGARVTLLFLMAADVRTGPSIQGELRQSLVQFAAMEKLNMLMASGLTQHSEAFECLEVLGEVSLDTCVYEVLLPLPRSGKHGAHMPFSESNLPSILEVELKKQQPGFHRRDCTFSSMRFDFVGNSTAAERRTTECWIVISLRFDTAGEVETTPMVNDSFVSTPIFISIHVRKIESFDAIEEDRRLTQQIILEELKETLDVCWFKMNQRLLLSSLCETEIASPFLLAPPPPVELPTARILASAPSVSKSDARKSLSLSSISITMPKKSSGSSTLPSIEKTVPRIKPRKAFEHGMFHCECVVEIVRPVYVGVTLAADQLERELPLCQRTVGNNNKYFIFGNFYMTLELNNEKTSKGVRLRLYGLEDMDSDSKDYLSKELDRVLVKITASKNPPFTLQYNSFLREVGASNPSTIRFSLPSYVQDPYYFCCIAKQVLARTTALTALDTTVNQRSTSVTAPDTTVNQRSTSVTAPDTTVNQRSTSVTAPDTTVNQRSTSVTAPDTTVSRNSSVAGVGTSLTVLRSFKHVHPACLGYDFAKGQPNWEAMEDFEGAGPPIHRLTRKASCVNEENSSYKHPCFFGSKTEAKKLSSSENDFPSFRGSAVQWDQDEFCFLYNNIQSSSGGSGRGKSQTKAPSNKLLHESGATNQYAKVSVQGLAVIDIRPVRRRDADVAFFDDIERFYATGSKKALEEDYTNLRRHLASNGVIAFAPHSVPEIAVEGNSCNSHNSADMDIHLRIISVIQMQSTQLSDLCYECIHQALVMYCIERIFTICNVYMQSGDSNHSEVEPCIKLVRTVMERAADHRIAERSSTRFPTPLVKPCDEIIRHAGDLSQQAAHELRNKLVEDITAAGVLFHGRVVNTTSASTATSHARAPVPWCTFSATDCPTQSFAFSELLGNLYLQAEDEDVRKIIEKADVDLSKYQEIEHLDGKICELIPSLLRCRRSFVEVVVTSYGYALYIYNLTAEKVKNIREKLVGAFPSSGKTQMDQLRLLGIPAGIGSPGRFLASQEPPLPLAVVGVLYGVLRRLLWGTRLLDRLSRPEAIVKSHSSNEEMKLLNRVNSCTPLSHIPYVELASGVVTEIFEISLPFLVDCKASHIGCFQRLVSVLDSMHCFDCDIVGQPVDGLVYVLSAIPGRVQFQSTEVRLIPSGSVVVTQRIVAVNRVLEAAAVKYAEIAGTHISIPSLRRAVSRILQEQTDTRSNTSLLHTTDSDAPIFALKNRLLVRLVQNLRYEIANEVTDIVDESSGLRIVRFCRNIARIQCGSSIVEVNIDLRTIARQLSLSWCALSEILPQTNSSDLIDVLSNASVAVSSNYIKSDQFKLLPFCNGAGKRSLLAFHFNCLADDATTRHRTRTNTRGPSVGGFALLFVDEDTPDHHITLIVVATPGHLSQSKLVLSPESLSIPPVYLPLRIDSPCPEDSLNASLLAAVESLLSAALIAHETNMAWDLLCDEEVTAASFEAVVTVSRALLHASTFVSVPQLKEFAHLTKFCPNLATTLNGIFGNRVVRMASTCKCGRHEIRSEATTEQSTQNAEAEYLVVIGQNVMVVIRSCELQSDVGIISKESPAGSTTCADHYFIQRVAEAVLCAFSEI